MTATMIIGTVCASLILITELSYPLPSKQTRNERHARAIIYGCCVVAFVVALTGDMVP